MAVFVVLAVLAQLQLLRVVADDYAAGIDQEVRERVRHVVMIAARSLRHVSKGMDDGSLGRGQALAEVRAYLVRLAGEDGSGAPPVFLLGSDGRLLVYPRHQGAEIQDSEDMAGGTVCGTAQELEALSRAGGGFVRCRLPLGGAGADPGQETLTYAMPLPGLDAFLASGHPVGYLHDEQARFEFQAQAIALVCLALVIAPLTLALCSSLRQGRALTREMERSKLARGLLRQSMARLKAVFEGSEMVAMVLAYEAESGPRIAEFNPGAEKIFDCLGDDILGRPLASLFAAEGAQSLHRALGKLREGQGLVAEEHELVRADGTVFPALVELSPVQGRDEKPGVLLTAVDISKRKHSEAVTYLLYRISDAVSATRDLNHLYETIHGIFIETLRARNFFIALLDEKNDRLVFPYFQDEMDGNYYEIQNISNPRTSSLTLEVIRTGKPLMMTRQQMLDMRKKTGLTPVGTLSRVWLGVPLTVRDSVIGAMVMQDYAHDTYFTKDDIGIMEAVSRQVALAIERKMNEEALHEASRAAESASRSKSEFLANMSHEIRTPLNGILGMADLTLNSELTDEQRANLDMLRDSGRALLRVLNDILDLSKIEAGKLELTEDAFRLRQFVRSVAEIFTVEVRRKGVDLLWTVEDDVPDLVSGDGGRLRQVLVNLVGNAVKFTDQGRVDVRVSRVPLPVRGNVNTPGAPVVLRFVVSDTGCGIPAEKQREIFESFSQVDGSLRRRYQGTGLGLTISRRLAEMMGGGITVESELGRGARFEFTAVCRVAAGMRTVESGRESNAGPLLRILVAEDNMVNMIYAKRTLERMGHAVVTASAGREVLEAVAREQFDCVFMDIQMPDMDGLEATRRIREQTGGATPSDVPIVAMTAHAMKGDRERFLAAGMDEYLSKPIEPDHLAEVLAKLFGGN